MTTLEFLGEESARFTRFGLICRDIGLVPRIVVDGREPLTSRAVRIVGDVVGGTLDGYMRFLVVREHGSAVEYWVAGSNSTRSIAATTVVFELSDDDLAALQRLVAEGKYVPGLMGGDGVESEWTILERALGTRQPEDLDVLLALLESNESRELSREAALGLRAFAVLAARRRGLQRRMERALLDHLERTDDTDTKIAIVENLGYVGTTNSSSPLGALIRSQDPEHDHVRWAATIALGRLNLRDTTVDLVEAASSSHMWTKAAALLALARRAEDSSRSKLEPVFVSALRHDDSVIRRYGCLGLSKFSSVDDESLVRMVQMFEDQGLPIGVRGYSALALSSVISSCSDAQRASIEAVVRQLDVDVGQEPNEPETVWGLEFVSELATLLELHEEADLLYSELSVLFEDWRGPYYEALALYERGESQVADAFRDEMQSYTSAIDTLASIESTEADARQAVAFRLDIIRGRRDLQEALRAWSDTFDPAQLERLAADLRNVAEVFARYSNARPTAEGVKRLSDREREYLNGTRRLVDVIRNVVLLEASWRTGDQPPERLRAIVRNLADVLTVLSGQFAGQLARGPLAVADAALESVTTTLEVLEDEAVPQAQRANSLKALTDELRGRFRDSTWPMPARACPIGGLGRGALAVVEEDTPGFGSEQDPFRFPRATPPVMNVLAEIHEMAPGGATRARVLCNVSGQTLVSQLHAVEGPVRCDFVLPDLSPVASSVCRFDLVFEARDCSQTAATLTVYVRSGD